jgi:hypothetical protein
VITKDGHVFTRNEAGADDTDTIRTLVLSHVSSCHENPPAYKPVRERGRATAATRPVPPASA